MAIHGPNCGCKEEHELASSYGCLLKHIDTRGIRVFNSNVDPESGHVIFKPFDQRLSDEIITNSPGEDPELLFTIPFSSPCDIAHLIIGNESDCVLDAKLFINKPEFDFSDLDVVGAACTLQLPPDFHGTIVHQLSILKFKDVYNLALYVTTNDGSPTIKLRYIGLRGKALIRNVAPVDAKYELIPEGNFERSLAETKNHGVF